MTKKEINQEKKNMGEIEFYNYFYGFDSDFIKEYINQFRESEKILQLIYNLLENNKNYKIKLYENSISIENEKTKDRYSILIEF